jgi:putative ATPase
MINGNDFRPIAERMRPREIAEVLGQPQLTDPGSALMRALAAKRPYSMILWGPPGCGKTTLARLIAQACEAEFAPISAVLAGVAELRQAVALAKSNRDLKRQTVLFVDEIHRFNKAQQDALLPHVEDGTIVLIGATTENPSFAVNGALLSRARVHVLKSVEPHVIVQLLQRALADLERGLGGKNADASALKRIAELSDGDARRALILLEVTAEIAGESVISNDHVEAAAGDGYRRFDKGGDLHFDQISALHKTIRSSNPDAALYWLVRMLDGGVDPEYLARRLTRVASEDIGNADPRALALALSAWQCFERLGAPEGELALAQLVLYLASAPKSNAAYVAFKAAKAFVAEHGTLEVPNHLRNAPTKLMKNLGFGAHYQYDHDAPDGIALSQFGFPEGFEATQFYYPVARGLEIKIADKLAWIRAERGRAQKSVKSSR